MADASVMRGVFHRYTSPIMCMKTCNRCNLAKALDEFYPKRHTTNRQFDPTKIGYYEPMCKACMSVDNQRKYNANKERRRQKQRAYGRAAKQWAMDLKCNPCMDCGQEFHPVCMDWDHRPGENKHRRVSVLTGKEAVLAEIAKCDLVCSNCHRLRTWKRQQNV